MKLTCTDCQKSFNLPAEKLPRSESVMVLPCPACKGRIEIPPLSPPPGTPASPPPPAEAPDTRATENPVPEDLPENLKEKIVASVEKLPPMPQIAQKARQMISDPQTTYQDVARVIETDQAIAAELLKISNSAYYGMSGRISSVKHAAAVLGTKTLMEILNLACAAGFLQGRLEGYDQEASDLWAHSLAVATGSKIIAGRTHPDLADEAFSAGLIHDVGKLILNPYVLERKDQFDAFVNNGEQSFLMAESRVLGFDHAEIAAQVCEKWKMPSHLYNAIRYHHEPAHSGDDALTHIVHVADVIAIMSGMGVGLDGMLYTMDEASMAFLGLEEAEIYDLLSEVIDAVTQTLETE